MLRTGIEDKRRDILYNCASHAERIHNNIIYNQGAKYIYIALLFFLKGRNKKDNRLSGVAQEREMHSGFPQRTVTIRFQMLHKMYSYYSLCRFVILRHFFHGRL